MKYRLMDLARAQTALAEIEAASDVVKTIMLNSSVDPISNTARLALIVGHLSSARRNLKIAAEEPAPLTAYARPVIAVDHERGETFHAERPDIDDQEREDKRAMVQEIATLAGALFEVRAGDFRDAQPTAAMIVDAVAEALSDGLT